MLILRADDVRISPLANPTKAAPSVMLARQLNSGKYPSELRVVGARSDVRGYSFRGILTSMLFFTG